MGFELSEQRPITWRYLGSETVIRPTSDYIFMLDEPVESAIVRPDAATKISGWAYFDDSPLTLHVVVDGDEVAVVGCRIDRPDVVDHFGGEIEGRVGFDVKLPAATGLGKNLELRFADASGVVRAVHLLSFGSSDTFKRMFLVHIPKTAGSSINAFMEDCVGERACATHVESDPGWMLDPRPDTIFGGKVFISGHVRASVLRQKLSLRNTLVTTMLRDPFDQLISHIAWVRKLADPGERERLYQHDIEIRRIAIYLASLNLGSPAVLGKWANGLSGEAELLFDNCQIRYLTDREPTGRVTQRDLAGAIENLQIFDLIGRSDRVPAFLAKVAEKMRLVRGSGTDLNVRENVTGTKYGLDAHDPRIREALEPLIQFDQVLYDKVTFRGSVAEAM